MEEVEPLWRDFVQPERDGGRMCWLMTVKRFTLD
jgi:hypothetical protein